MHPIKLGIIGCGIAARDLHWPALQSVRDKFDITAVCNHTEPKAKAFAAMAGGVPYYLDYHDLLKNPDVEAVDIILPIHLNYQVTRDALEHEKHVIVEKPLAANLPDAKKMVAFEHRYHQVMMVAENYRYNPLFEHLQHELSQGKIGTPYAVFWDIFRCLDRSNKYVHTTWRIQHQHAGGFITDAGIHNIAILRDLFGDIISGNTLRKRINPEIGELDSMSFQFITTKEVHGVFNMYYSVHGHTENRLLILGDTGSILVEDDLVTLKKR